ncbi:MAG: hypothetical protein KGZ85_13345 [Ignavibacterium sp.]|nr:hypothetical protein [Ignavibacterium sp.]
MKALLVLICLVSFLCFNNITYAQGEAAVPFLLLQPSPSLSAMGQTGTALPTDDPFGFLWNPAQLGYSSQNNNLSYIFYPNKLHWLPVFNSGLEVKAVAFNAGYNFKELIGFPVSAGFGYSKVELNFGEFVQTGPGSPDPIGTFEPKDFYNAYSIGLGLDYLVQLSIGYTVKDVTSFLADFSPSPDSGEVKAETTVKDFGILLDVPVLKLIDDKMNIVLSEKLTAYPTFNFSLGYSKSNIGDSINYSGLIQSDPLPRIERIGYGISAGFDLAEDNLRFNAFNLSFTVEADDILISRSGMPSGHWEYQDDLDIWENVILIKGNNKIVSHAGTKLDFAETFSYSFGHFSGRGFDSRKTNGYELKIKGLLKAVAYWVNHPVTNFLRDHFDVRYYNTNFFADHELETKMTGLAFHLKNIHKLF